MNKTVGSEKGETLDEGAAFLGVSPHTLRFYVKTGRVTYYRIGRRIIFRREDLEEFLSKNRVPAREE